MSVLSYPETGASAPVFPAEGQALRVTAIRWLAPSIREIELTRPDGAALPRAQPGAHIDLALPGGLSRSYSLVNAPGEARAWRIAVNRDAASRGGSAHLVESLRAGEMLTVSAPVNSFALVPANLTIFVAGGIGITPILSMIRARVALSLPWTLHYAVRSAEAAAYLPELRALMAQGGHLHLHDDAATGRHFDMTRIIAAPEAHLYCCGPAPMIAAFQAAFADRPADHLHVEHFANNFQPGTKGFTVVLKRKGLTLQVPPGKTIMDVLMAAGIRVAHSCREGVCGTCETRVIEGTPLHRDKVLSDRERASGRVMMICCSGAESDRLVLDI